MPMTTTHALVPLAGALAFANRPIPWKLVTLAALAAAFPDIDGINRHLWTLPAGSVYAHRGAAHSLFVMTAAVMKPFLATASSKACRVARSFTSS